MMINLARVPFFHCAVLLPKWHNKGLCLAHDAIMSPVKEDKIKHLFDSDNYWSSTTYKNNTDNAWIVNFNNGNVNNNNKDNTNHVRCVRAGEWNV